MIVFWLLKQSRTTATFLAGLNVFLMGILYPESLLYGGLIFPDHYRLSFRYFLLVEVLKDVWSLYSDGSAIVKERAEYFVASLGDVSLAMYRSSRLVRPWIKPHESGKVFGCGESLNVGNLCYKSGCRGGTKSVDRWGGLTKYIGIPTAGSLFSRNNSIPKVVCCYYMNNE